MIVKKRGKETDTVPSCVTCYIIYTDLRHRPLSFYFTSPFFPSAFALTLESKGLLVWSKYFCLVFLVFFSPLKKHASRTAGHSFPRVILYYFIMYFLLIWFGRVFGVVLVSVVAVLVVRLMFAFYFGRERNGVSFDSGPNFPIVSWC